MNLSYGKNKHGRADDNINDKDNLDICSSIKKMRIKSDLIPLNKRLPPVSGDTGSPEGDTDYTGCITPILNELEILRSFRRSKIRMNPWGHSWIDHIASNDVKGSDCHSTDNMSSSQGYLMKTKTTVDSKISHEYEEDGEFFCDGEEGMNEEYDAGEAMDEDESI
jgi:hypothetical protein